MASIIERQALWDQFLKRWPIANLEMLTLQEYCQAGNTDVFIFWMESKTSILGSMWGGSAFKFGVYSRKDQSEKVEGSGKSYNEQYAWYTKYGDNAEKAFEIVRSHIVAIAKAAQNGDLEQIEKIDIGTAFKWKIAFLYQNQNRPSILPIYKSEYLRIITESTEKRMSIMNRQIMQEINDRNVLEYGDELWSTLEPKLKTELSPSEAKAYLDQSESFGSIKAPTKYIAGYQHKLEQRHQLALTLDNQKTTIYFNPGNWIQSIESQLQEVIYYTAEKSRSSNIAANAPQLAVGNPMIKAVVPNMSALIAVIEAYEKIDSSDTKLTNKSNSLPTDSEIRTMPPLNQILFGPPGTGKTYATIDEALRILDKNFLTTNQNNRDALKKRFDELEAGGHIRFVTFHQSFSYEDFVEGLRAENDPDGNLRYEVKEGVFKEICDSAAAKVTKQAETHIELTGRKIWKMSLGNTQGEDAYIYEDCIENGYALLGWGGLTDFSNCKNREDVYQEFLKSGHKVNKDDYAVRAVSTFLLKLKVGDLIVVSDGNTKFRAIGEITSQYRSISREAQEDLYGQCRNVKWLRVYKPSLPSNQLMHNQFSQMTLYQLHNSSIDLKALAALLNVATPPNYRLISDIYQVNELIGNYKVAKITEDLIELTKPNGSTLPIGMSLLKALAEYVRNGKISIEDIRNKAVFDKVPDSSLEKFLVNGYNNILPYLVSKLVSNKILDPNLNAGHLENNRKVLIIDEINRGNISRIFGELITLIEPSKREGADEALKITLPYSKKPFMVPGNVFIIGTMNTADRSLSGLDIALRRRFIFKEMPPQPELLKNTFVEGVNVGDILEVMNERIEVLFDREHCLGHAYFMPLRKENTLPKLSLIFRSQILPLLQEYFFEDWERIAWILNDQNKSSNQAFVQNSNNNLSGLFGNTAEMLQNLDKRWHINEAAFNNIESYKGILGVAN
ncbi:AAA family ATPase [Methylophilus luteus]|uniref:AAA family ATPase n=1 Tax=Methylophilus luteus TaxID=640108 RepID=A0ABW3FBQ4_9PROT